jgi:MoaA/NifB/PqqE/SkfB family radical SAM enzyme
MLHVLKRGIHILHKDGLSAFIQKFASYAASYAKYRFAPSADSKNANWHVYVRELDARAEIVTCTPWKLGFESTSLCNLQCVMCEHIFIRPRQGQHFDMALLEKFKDYIAAAGEFQLMGLGEPLISPAFWKLAEHIRQTHTRPPRIAVSSNAAALTRRFVERLLDSPLEEISFSLDAARSETYRKIRNADFDKTLGNIRYFLQRRRERGQRLPLVMCNMTLMRENIDELAPFVSLAAELGADAVSFWPLHDYDPARTAGWKVERNGWTFSYRDQMLGRDKEDAVRANAEIDNAVNLAKKLEMRIVLPTGGLAHIMAPQQADGPPPEFDLRRPCAGTASSPGMERPSPRECVAPWEWMTVSWNGDVRVCCYVAQSFGNIHETRPEDIWNGPDYREMRRALARGMLPRQCCNAACKYARGAWIYSSGANHSFATDLKTC